MSRKFILLSDVSVTGSLHRFLRAAASIYENILRSRCVASVTDSMRVARKAKNMLPRVSNLFPIEFSSRRSRCIHAVRVS